MLLAYKTFTPEPTIHYTYTHREDQPLTIHRNNTSVPEAVREILTRNYPVYQCLKMKLMNFHSLAEFIQPQVQQLSGKEASINTLVVAIKRFSDTLTNSKGPDTSRVLKDARISLSSGIVDVTMRVPRNQFSTIVRELSDVLFRNGVNILDAFLGYGDIIIVVDDKDGPLAYDVLQREIQGPMPRE